LILIIFKDAVLTTEFSVLWNDMENDHENFGTGADALSQHTLYAAVRKMMRKGNEQTCLI
jgi:hypothetical protein